MSIRTSVIHFFCVVVCSVFTVGCARNAYNFDLLTEPLTGGSFHAQPCPATDDSLTMVTFNIKFSYNITRAIGVLRSIQEARWVDAIFLQEMDLYGTKQIADALGMYWAYAPGTVHPQPGHEFGVAIVSPWKLEDSRRLLLPATGWWEGTRRVALKAGSEVEGVPITWCTARPATPVEASPCARRRQVREVAKWGKENSPGVIVFGGDINDPTIGHVCTQEGYQWVTKGINVPEKRILCVNVGPLKSIDHVFFFPSDAAGGTCRREKCDSEISDHEPVVVRFKLKKG